MSAKEMVLLFVVLSPTTSAVAMEAVEDEELAGVLAGACTEKCSPGTGSTCLYEPSEACQQIWQTCPNEYGYPEPCPMGCTNPGAPCKQKLTGPFKDDLCVEGDPSDTCPLRDSQTCVQMKHGQCAGILACTCETTRGAQWEGSRATCE